MTIPMRTNDASSDVATKASRPRVFDSSWTFGRRTSMAVFFSRMSSSWQYVQDHDNVDKQAPDRRAHPSFLLQPPGEYFWMRPLDFQQVDAVVVAQLLKIRRSVA